MDWNQYIRDIPDFPKKGIVFKDLTTLWKNSGVFKAHIDALAEKFQNKGINKVAGTESRGFIVGAPLAYLLGAGFVPIRKAGKLPAETISKKYSLEYGEAAVEIHKDAIEKGESVLFADDLLATGGTTKASIEIVRSLGGHIIGCAFIIELAFLNGRKLIDAPVESLVTID